MKKVIFSALALLMTLTLILSLTPSTKSVEASSFSKKADAAFVDSLLMEFDSNEDLHDRTSFSEGERKSAEHIKLYFDELGGLETELQEFSTTQNGTTYESQNIIATLKSTDPTADRKRVIVGAHYDNVYSASNGGHGIYDNASGITAVMAAAKSLVDSQVRLPFSVVFVLFGAEEAGMYGSYNFALKHAEDTANILLMLNFDAIGGGDNLYMYCDEVKRQHDTFLREVFSTLGSGITLHEPPKNKRTFLSPNFYANYSHYGLLSSNNVFIALGINTASFLSFDWESNGYGFVESASKKSIINTSEDTLENLKLLYPDYAEKIAACANLTISALNDTNFQTQMQESKASRMSYAFFTNPIYSYFVLMVLLIGLAFVSFYISKKWNKEHPRPVIIKLTNNDLRNTSSGVFGSEYENPGPLKDLLSDLQKEIDKKRDENNPFDGY